MYDMEGSLWYIISWENVVERVYISMFPFSFWKKWQKENQKQAAHRKLCVYIFLNIILFVCTSKKVMKGPITRKTAGLGNRRGHGGRGGNGGLGRCDSFIYNELEVLGNRNKEAPPTWKLFQSWPKGGTLSWSPALNLSLGSWCDLTSWPLLDLPCSSSGPHKEKPGPLTVDINSFRTDSRLSNIPTWHLPH